MTNASQTRVDFAFGVDNRIQAASKSVYKHFLAGHSILIYSTDAKRTQLFSKALWSVHNTAFVAHEIITSDNLPDPKLPQTDCRIKITSLEPSALLSSDMQTQPWLLNLDLQCPSDFLKFNRILEIVSNHEEDLAHARLRWQNYKQAGAQLFAHSMN